MSVVYALLVGHFVADFLCQSDWMALNKSKRWDALGVHVLVYSLVLFPFVAFWHDAAFLQRPMATYGVVWMFIGVNAAAHFAQDALTSRLTSRLWFLPQVGQGMQPEWIQVEVKGGYRHWFFVAIGFDQLLHYVTLFVTASWWLA